MRLKFSDATIGSALKNRPTILGPCFVISDPLAGHYVAFISAFILCGSYNRSVFITNDPPALRNIGNKVRISKADGASGQIYLKRALYGSLSSGTLCLGDIGRADFRFLHYSSKRLTIKSPRYNRIIGD